MFSPDGETIYYTQNITPGPIFEYAQDSNTQLFQIKAYNMETGDISVAAGGAGGAVRPTPSPDGKYLAYVKRVRADSKLFVKDLKSGEERMVFDHLDQDMQETWGTQGMYPNMDWTPDSETLYFWAGGQIHSVDIDSGDVEHIDFLVKDTRTIMDPPRPVIDVAPDEFKVQMPRFTHISPDGTRLVYEALGKLHIRDVKSGKTRRVTDLPEGLRELYPSWSRDSHKIIFTTWDDEGLGAIHSIDVRSQKITTHSEDPGHYSRPTFSPSGEFIAYEKGSGGFLTAPEWSNATGLYIQAVDGGEPVHISKSGSNPHFGAEDLRVFFSKREDKTNSLISTNLLGHDERKHASNLMAQSYHVSPDGTMIAFRENYNLHVTPALKGPQNFSADRNSKALPVSTVSFGGATYPSWTQDNQLHWSLGPTLFSVGADDAMKDDFEAVKAGKILVHTAKADKPTGQIALTNARIVTMAGKDGGVIENGTILIDGDRIAAVGADINIQDVEKTVDLDGKTIEYQRAGKLLSPRTYSTGEVIYGAKSPGFFADIQNEEDAQEHVGRLKNQGAHGVKNYNQPRREQRQQVVKAGHDKNLIVAAEGGSLYHMDMSLVADGNSSLEHNLPVSAIYDDVVQMFSQTEVAYTHAGAGAKKLMEAGVPVSIGGHGQREGLASHWEMWSFARGGMSPLQALMTATTEPARHLGFDKDLGTLEKGKLADLVVLSDNPLDDIRHTDNVDHVMIGGRLYEASTMNEVVTGDSERLPYWWED